MIRKYLKIILPTILMLLMAILVSASQPEKIGEKGLEIRMKPMPEGARKVFLAPGPEPQWRVLGLDGSEKTLSSEAFTRRLYRNAVKRPPLLRLLNISSPAGIAWVFLGLFGQLLFTGRMVVQWLTSERARRSVVPVTFWWMSLSGATMLLIYFIWRRDIVGILGQSTGWFIYSRNLWLIYRKAH